MSSSFRHIDTARFMGSWPVLQDSATILPRTLHTSARILGTVRETSSGYDIDGRSFYVVVDGEPPFSVTFSSITPLTLDEVITQINADSQVAISQDIAFRDNGFLLLKSPTTGTTSYLRIYTDSASSPTDVFEKLGLFSETESFGGDIASATHVDPDRQVAMPDQMSVMEGEPLTARVINRALMQLSLQNDMVYNLTHRRRLARSTTEEIASYSSSTPEGYQFSGGTMVYVGPDTTPSAAQLAKYFQIIGPDGKEFTKEEITQLNDYPGTIYCVEVGEHLSQVGGAAVPIYETRVVSSVAIFTAADVESNIYVTVTMAGVPALSGIPLKVIRLISTTEAVFRPIDPVTGDDLVNDVLAEVGTGGAYASDIVRQSVELVPCQVEAVYDTAGGSRVEGVNTARVSSIVPTKVELGNRIVFAGEDVVTAGAAIGDELIWSGHTPSSGVQDNNGTYRISAVIDAETVEVVTGTWEPAVLTSDLFTAGTVDIQVDGVYVEDPFVKFVASPGGAIPEVGDSLTIQYYGMKTLKEAWDDDDTLISGDLERQHESSDIIEKAILNILGPSTNNLDEYVRQQASNNLEALDYRIDREHYRLGKHRTISADGIFVYQNATNNEYLDQRSPENWGAELATFWHRGDLGTGEAVASIVTKSTDVDPGGATDYIGGFKVFIEGASSDKNLWAYKSDITVESDTDLNSSAAIGYRSDVNFSDGNIDTVAHFRGEIPTWTGTNSLAKEYGVYLPAMSRGATQVGLQIDGMSGSTVEASAVIAGPISAPATAAISLGTVTATASLAFGTYIGAVSGVSEGTIYRGESVTCSSGNAALLRATTVNGSGSAHGIFSTGITAGTGAAAALRVTNGITSTSGSAYFAVTGDIDANGSAYGIQTANINGTTGGAYFLFSGTIIGSAFARGIRTLGLSGGEASGAIINGVITGTSGEGTGFLVTDTISGVTAGHLAKSEGISSSTGDAGGMRTGAITSTAAEAYGVNVTGTITAGTSAYGFSASNITGAYGHGMAVGSITGSTAAAYGVYTGAVTAATTAYGAQFGNISGNTGSGVGVSLGTVDSTSAASSGFTSGVITGDTAARGVYIAGLALNVGGSGPSSAFQCDSIAGTDAYALYSGNITAGSTAGDEAVGIHFGNISGANTFGLYSTAVISSDGPSYFLRTGTLQGASAAYGMWITSIAALGSSAIAIRIGTIDATTTAYGVYTEDITGGNFTRAFRSGNLTAGQTAGVLINGTITASTGEADGFRVAGALSGTTEAYGLRAGAISASAGPAYGVLTGSVSGTGSAAAVSTTSVTSSTGSAVGFYSGAVTGSSGRGLQVISVEANGNGTNAYGIELGQVSQTNATAGNAYGVSIVGVSTVVNAGYGFHVGALSSNGNAYGFHATSINSVSGNAYGLYLPATITAGSSAWAIYSAGTASNWLGGVLYVDASILAGTTGSGAIGSSTRQWASGDFSDYITIGAVGPPANNVGLRTWHTYTDADAQISYELVSTVTSTKNDAGTIIQAGRFVAESEPSSAIQTSVTAVNAVSLCSATGTGGVTDMYGVFASTGIGSAVADVNRSAAIYAEPGTRSSNPDYDFGIRVKPHTAGSLASATAYFEGGAIIIDGDEATASFAISPTLNLLGAANYAAATEYAVNLIGDGTDPALLNFDNVGITNTLGGGSFYMGFSEPASRKFILTAGSRDRTTVNTPVFQVDMGNNFTEFFINRVRIERGARCFEVDCEPPTTTTFSPTATVDLNLNALGGAIGAGHAVSRVFVDCVNDLASDGTYSGTLRGFFSRIDPPGTLTSGADVAIAFSAIVGQTYGTAVYGSSVGFDSVLQLETSTTSLGASSQATGFRSNIQDSSQYAERRGFYVASQDIGASAGNWSAGFDIESMQSFPGPASLFGYRAGTITSGASAHLQTGSSVYGLYLDTITIWDNGSCTARGVNIQAVTAQGPDSGSVSTGFRVGSVTGYTAHGAELIGTHAVGGQGFGLRIEDVDSTTSNATGIEVFDLDGPSANAYGVNIIDVDSTGQTFGVRVNDINASTTGVGWGARFDTVTGDTAIGVDITTVFCTNSGSDSFGLRINAIGSGTITTADAHGIHVQSVTANAAQDAYGVRINQPTGGANNWALYTPGSAYFGDLTTDLFISNAMRKSIAGAGATGDLAVVTTAGGGHSVGSVGIGPSIREYKTNIRDMGNTDWVYDLRPVRFAFKGNEDVEQFGLIAEEVEEVEPILAVYMDDEKKVEEGYVPAPGEKIVTRGDTTLAVTSKLFSVAYKSLIPVLLNEVQRLNKRLAEVETRLN